MVSPETRHKTFDKHWKGHFSGENQRGNRRTPDTDTRTAPSPAAPSISSLERGQPPQVQGASSAQSPDKCKAKFSKLVQASCVGSSEVVPPGSMLTHVPQTFAATINSSGLQEVATPASGNCLPWQSRTERLKKTLQRQRQSLDS
ncbi:unnamed protein product [Peronospora belbahrii]|uniref:Uncharacterized protein n=1 Tax=Peronospora belbahrii TaxID=622444 RepID=A0AAU9L7S0_9STRA|nr:unnamed protein product [Peronospora belbahrii]CAH0513877.1 unnamed protein product [Peronospora belbahrii]